jgi:predicted AlkP superfamily pyrophosphatase or phosphodiesterase
MKIIICVDGLGKDLLNEENSPFLFGLSKRKHFSELKTFFAFTGIEYGFFSGKTPEESKVWMEFCKSQDSIFNNKILKILSFNKTLRDYFAVLIQLLNGRTWLSGLHNIPKEKLKDFDTTLKKNLWESEFFKNKDFVFYKWPFFVYSNKGKVEKKIIFYKENDEERINRLLSIKNKEIYYVQLLSVDKTIHKFGKKSPQTKNAIKNLDKTLERKLKNLIEDNDFFLWSDHGFYDVKNYINIEKILPKKEGYTYFTSGTTISFWFKDKKIKEEIINKLSKIKELELLNKKMADKLNVPFDKKDGELVFFVRKGEYFFPNFYQRSHKERFVSMHGYPSGKELSGFLITNKKVPKTLKINEIIKHIK